MRFYPRHLTFRLFRLGAFHVASRGKLLVFLADIVESFPDGLSKRKAVRVGEGDPGRGGCDFPVFPGAFQVDVGLLFGEPIGNRLEVPGDRLRKGDDPGCVSHGSKHLR